MESKYIFHLTEKLCVDIIIRRASEREFLVCEKADLQQPQSISQEVKRMPTFNQLVRKGRQISAKKSTAPALQNNFFKNCGFGQRP